MTASPPDGTAAPAHPPAASAVPRVGIGIALTRGGQVLLGLRRGAHGAGTWAFPGGHLDFGEAPEACAARELAEETGLAPNGPFAHTGTCNDWMPDEGRHYITLILEAAAHPNAEPQRLEPEKCAAWRWCDWDALPQPLFGPLASLVARGWRPGAGAIAADAQRAGRAPTTAAAAAALARACLGPASLHMAPPTGRVVAVARDDAHHFSKRLQASLTLVEGLGVAGDSHAGATVQHRSRVAQDPTQPNLRQVHLLAGEGLDALAAQGFAVAPGQMGENITTRGLDLLALPEGTVLHIGAQAQVRLTGLRNPCAQIDAFQPGLLAAVLDRTADGRLVRKAGVMGVVVQGGAVQPGDAIAVQRPPGAPRPLERV